MTSRYCFIWCCLLALLPAGMPFVAAAQADTAQSLSPDPPPLLRGRPRPPAIQSSAGNCRAARWMRKPLVEHDNPFFYDHRWDSTMRMESAQLSPERHVFIEQSGCDNYHRKITLTTAPTVSRQQDLGFYALELFNLMNRLFYNSTDYWRYKLQFEQLFLQKFPNHGLDQAFRFQLADYTFICEFSFHQEVGAVCILEIVNLPPLGAIRYPGIPTYEDDGYFVPPTLQRN